MKSIFKHLTINRRKDMEENFKLKALFAQLVKSIYIDRNSIDVADPNLTTDNINWIKVALEAIRSFNYELKKSIDKDVKIEFINSSGKKQKVPVNEENATLLTNYLLWLLSLPPKRYLNNIKKKSVKIVDLYIPRLSAIFDSLLDNKFYLSKSDFNQLNEFIRLRPAYLAAIANLIGQNNKEIKNKISLLQENILKLNVVDINDIKQCEKTVKEWIDLGILI